MCSQLQSDNHDRSQGDDVLKFFWTSMPQARPAAACRGFSGSWRNPPTEKRKPNRLGRHRQAPQKGFPNLISICEGFGQLAKVVRRRALVLSTELTEGLWGADFGLSTFSRYLAPKSFTRRSSLYPSRVCLCSCRAPALAMVPCQAPRLPGSLAHPAAPFASCPHCAARHTQHFYNHPG